MALTYRSPVEEVIARCTSEEQSAISAHAIKGIKLKEINSHDLFNFALPVKAKEKLTKMGMYLSHLSYVPHSHPVCKTLENYMLYVVAPQYLSNSFYFVGIKNYKLDFLKSRNSKLSLITTINRFVTSLDKSRYANDLVCLSSLSDTSLLRHKGISRSDALRELLPEAIRLKSRKFFIHDELHYWSASDAIYFLEETNAEMVLATLVIPPETLVGATESMNKWAYSFKVDGTKLIFAPDSSWNDAYVQPYSARFWLKAKSLTLSDGKIYNVDILCSKASHHLISITAGSLKCQESRAFGDFDAINLSKLDPYTRKIRHCFPVSHELVMKMYMYLRCLKKGDIESAVAKIRQMIDMPTGRELKFLEDFARFVLSTNSTSGVVHYSKVKRFVASMFPHCIGQFMSLYNQTSLNDFIYDLEVFNFRIQTINVDRSFFDQISFDPVIEQLVEVDPEELIDAKFMTGQCSFNCREDQEYQLGDDFWLFSDHRMSYRYEGVNYHTLVKVAASFCLLNGWEADSAELQLFTIGLFKGGRKALKFELLCGSSEFKRRVCLTLRRLRAARMREMNLTFHSCEWFLRGDRKYQLYLCGSGEEGASTLLERTKKVFSSIVDMYFKDNLLNQSRDKLTAANIVAKVIPKKKNKSVAVTREEVGEGNSKEFHSNDEVAKESSPGYDELSKAQIPKDEELRALIERSKKSLIAKGYTFKGTSSIEKEVQVVKTSALQAKEPIGSNSQVEQSTGPINRLESEQRGIPKREFAQFEELFRKMLGDRRFSLETYLCGCFGGPFLVHQGVFSDFAKKVKYLEMSLNDAVTVVKGKSDQRYHELFFKHFSNCSVLTFGCEAEVIIKGGDTSEKKVLVEKYHTIGNVVGISRIPVGGIVVLLAQSDCLLSGMKETHNVGCFFSGSSCIINRCPIVVTKEYKIEDFNIFSVPGDGNCFWHSIGFLLASDGIERKKGLVSLLKAKGDERVLGSISDQVVENAYAEKEIVAAFCSTMRYRLVVITPEYEVCWVFGEECWEMLGFLTLSGLHYEPLAPKNGCMIRAIASALGRRETDVLHHLCKPKTRYIFEDLCKGGGMNVAFLEDVFVAFSIRAACDFGSHIEIINDSGSLPATFNLGEGHIEHVPEKKLRKANPKVDSLRIVGQSSFAILEMNGTSFEYRPDLDRAICLQRSFLEGKTGSISSNVFGNAEEEQLENAQGFMKIRKIVAILGTFGSGKSWLYKKFIEASPGKDVIFVSPRRQLADSIKVELGIGLAENRRKMSGIEVITFEVFIKKIGNLKRNHVVIVDEIQLFPPGYMDLIMHISEPSVRFVIAGDPCQACYDSKGDRATFSEVALDVHHLLRERSYKYNICSKRFTNPMFLNRLPCKLDAGRLKAASEPYEVYPGMNALTFYFKDGLEVVLVSSFEEKKIVHSYLGAGQKTLTFGESTGMTFKKGAILITYDSVHADENRWITALSRFSENVFFVNEMGITMENILATFQGRFLYKFLVAKSSEEDIVKMLPGKPALIEKFDLRIGKDEGIAEEKLQGDPWLKSEMFLGQHPDIVEEQIQEGGVEEPWFKHHLMIAEVEGVRARWAAKLALKERREFRIGYDTTEQFIDTHLPYGEALTNACEKYEAIYPRHKGTDSITFLMAVKKRLKFSRPDIEQAKFRKAKPYGKFLLSKFLHHVKINAEHDKLMMEAAVREFEEKKLSKSAATIANHSGRSCRDWLADTALIFMKSQHCTKFDNRFRDAKAGQTLACFHHSVLCRFAPYMRYIEKKVMSGVELGQNFYIHSGKNIEQLDEWVKSKKFEGECTESDYEAFDSSQDHYILAFEMQLMEYLGLPSDLLEDYLYIKTHLGSKLGNFSIMRFTGEASTFLFNTLANMLFTFLRYDLRKSDCIAFAGDDMCANSRLRISKKHEDFLNKLSLKAKVQFVKNPTFCGWCLNRYGVYKRPQLVWERICIARERKNIENCIDNYSIEVSYAYKLGELLSDIMSAEEIENQYLCVRFIVRNKHLLKSSIRDLFSNI